MFLAELNKMKYGVLLYVLWTVYKLLVHSTNKVSKSSAWGYCSRCWRKQDGDNMVPDLQRGSNVNEGAKELDRSYKWYIVVKLPGGGVIENKITNVSRI
jgi:hypothetical protein